MFVVPVEGTPLSLYRRFELLKRDVERIDKIVSNMRDVFTTSNIHVTFANQSLTEILNRLVDAHGNPHITGNLIVDGDVIINGTAEPTPLNENEQQILSDLGRMKTSITKLRDGGHYILEGEGEGEKIIQFKILFDFDAFAQGMEALISEEGRLDLRMILILQEFVEVYEIEQAVIDTALGFQVEDNVRVQWDNFLKEHEQLDILITQLRREMQPAQTADAYTDLGEEDSVFSDPLTGYYKTVVGFVMELTAVSLTIEAKVLQDAFNPLDLLQQRKADRYPLYSNVRQYALGLTAFLNNAINKEGLDLHSTNLNTLKKIYNEQDKWKTLFDQNKLIYPYSPNDGTEKAFNTLHAFLKTVIEGTPAPEPPVLPESVLEEINVFQQREWRLRQEMSEEGFAPNTDWWEGITNYITALMTYLDTLSDYSENTAVRNYLDILYGFGIFQSLDLQFGMGTADINIKNAYYAAMERLHKFVTDGILEPWVPPPVVEDLSVPDAVHAQITILNSQITKIYQYYMGTTPTGSNEDYLDQLQRYTRGVDLLLTSLTPPYSLPIKSELNERLYYWETQFINNPLAYPNGAYTDRRVDNFTKQLLLAEHETLRRAVQEGTIY
jgi:hypothetical protein